MMSSCSARYFAFLAVKEQKRVNEQWQVVDERNVESAIVIEHFRRYVEDVGEVDPANCVSHCASPLTASDAVRSPFVAERASGWRIPEAPEARQLTSGPSYGRSSASDS